MLFVEFLPRPPRAFALHQYVLYRHKPSQQDRRGVKEGEGERSGGGVFSDLLNRKGQRDTTRRRSEGGSDGCANDIH
jgi:hypothetical protein